MDPQFTQFLPSIIIQFILVIVSGLICYKTWKAYLNTGDSSFKFFSISFFFNTLNILILLFLVTSIAITNNFFLYSYLAPIARLVLNIGIIIFLFIPIIWEGALLKKIKGLVVALLFLTTFLGVYIAIKNPIIVSFSETGVPIENIESKFLLTMLLLTPITVATIWAFEILQALKETESVLNKIKAYFMIVGLLVVTLGQSFYLSSSTGHQSFIGLALVIFGFFSVLLSSTFNDMRRFFVKVIEK